MIASSKNTRTNDSRHPVQSSRAARNGDTGDSIPRSYAEITFRDAWQATEKPEAMREVIIDGLLRRGEVANCIASTKTGKSWFALLMLMSVALGRDWLGRRVSRGNVLLIDNELHRETIENRLAAVHSAMQVHESTPKARFEYVACRGNWLSLSELTVEIPKKHQPGSLNLIVIDAKYRLFGNGLEENNNDHQTSFHNELDRFANVMNCPILLIHHSTKGDQSGKSVTDVGSGGGSQSRAVDLHLVIRPHRQIGHAVMEAAVRSFPNVEPVSLQWAFPLWTVASDIPPELLAKRHTNSSTEALQEKILKAASDEWQSLSKIADACGTKPRRGNFSGAVDALVQQGRLESQQDYIPKNSTRKTRALRIRSSDTGTTDNN